MATPAPRYSASSGWAPKTMMRSLPSCGGGAGDWAVGVWAKATRGCWSMTLPRTNPRPQAAIRVTTENFILIPPSNNLHLFRIDRSVTRGSRNQRRKKRLTRRRRGRGGRRGENEFTADAPRRREKKERQHLRAH